MIKSSLYFTYNGVNSKDYGVMNISISSGLFEEPFVGSLNILEQTIRRKTDPYFFQIKPTTKTINLSFSLPENFTESDAREIARWLTKDYYCPLIFSDEPDKIYYCVLSGDSAINHTGKNGYLTLSMRTNSPYSFSPIFNSPIHDLSNNTANGTEIIITNNGDVDMFSIINVQVISDGSFSIVNKSKSGEKIAFTGLQNNEIVAINTEIEDIQTSVPNTYRYDNMTSDSKFILFSRGINRVQIYGKVKIQFKHEARFLI